MNVFGKNICITIKQSHVIEKRTMKSYILYFFVFPSFLPYQNDYNCGIFITHVMQHDVIYHGCNIFVTKNML